MSWVILGVLLVLLIAVLVMRQRAAAATGEPSEHRQVGPGSRRPSRGVSADELASVKRSADEDVTVFGDDLRTLDADLAGRPLDEPARQDYQRALDAYEASKESVAAVTRPDEVRHVTEILEDGRYAIACVRARVVGEPPPQRRPPCFFNPQHGPSVRDVAWSPAGGLARDVPVCAADGERLASGAEPMTRQVMVGPRRMPYWQAGPAYAPWTAGYFGSFGLIEGLFIGTMLGGMFDGNGYDQGYDAGYDQGHDQGQDQVDSGGSDGGEYDGGGDSGGSDGGGFDGGGFDGGGFDGGGFDMGGGDF